MNSNEKQSLIEWLETKNKKSPISKIRLFHSSTNRQVDQLEIDVGESTSDFGLRLWDVVESDSGAFEGRQVYYLSLFRDGSEEAEASRTIRVFGDEDESKFGDDRTMLAQSFRHTEQMARTMFQMSSVALDRSDRENDRLQSRLAKMEDAQFEMWARHRQLVLDEGEMKVRQEEAKATTAITTAALGQLDLLAPLLMSKFMGEGAGATAPGGDVERRMLRDFLVTLSPEQQFQIVGCLDSVQRIAVGALQKDEIDPKFEGIHITRLMASITEDQLRSIMQICNSDEQRFAFERILDQRKHGLAYAAHKALAEENSAPAGE